MICDECGIVIDGNAYQAYDIPTFCEECYAGYLRQVRAKDEEYQRCIYEDIEQMMRKGS